MANRTWTTTEIKSHKDGEGNWVEISKVVTTVQERDDDGYPYGPVPNVPGGITDYAKRVYGDLGISPYGYGPYFGLAGFRPRPAAKPEQQEEGKGDV